LAGPDHPLARAALREVVDLHAFFEAWLGGTAPNTDAEFARLDAVLAESFTMVSTDGRRLSRADVTGSLRKAHGLRGRAAPFRIFIVEPEILHVQTPLIAVRYVEEQSAPDTITRRRSTALFEALPDDPSRVQWLALHETWTGSGS
jgi:hypothetical protein